jgi:uncharacterized protein YdaU (DUF1376 family)
MAALPYMQLYIADYLADTMHLSTEEHGAYLLLMFNYWQTGKPIPKNRLAKIARVPNDRWLSIEQTLSEFFEDDGESWVHLRIERDMESVVSTSKGKKYADGKSLADYKGKIYFITSPELDIVKIGYSKNPWARLSELRSSYGSSIRVVATINLVSKPNISVATVLSDFEKENSWFVKNECVNSIISAVKKGEITTVEAILDYVENYRSNYDSYISAPTVAATTTTNTDKDTDKELKDPPLNPPKGKPLGNKFDPLSVELPEWLPAALWAEWVEYRKALRKPIKTSQGANGSIRELDKYRGEGITPEQVIRHSIAREYQGLYPPKVILASRSGSRDVNSISQPDNSIPPGFRG